MKLKDKEFIGIGTGVIAFMSVILIVFGIFQTTRIQQDKLYDVVSEDLFKSEIQNQTREVSSINSTETQGDWLDFNSKKDVQLSAEFTFKYPSLWKHMGSIDGGSASMISFFDRNEYSQFCKDSVGSCAEKLTEVARIMISSLSMIPVKREYDNETVENIVVDGYKGVKFFGEVKSDTVRNYHIGKPGQKEMGMVIPDIKGLRFEFIMTSTNGDSKEIFDTLVKSINFKF